MADTRKQYPYGADNVPVGYVLTHYADGAFWVDPEPKWETPLTVERLVRVLRLAGGIHGMIADALEADDEV